MTGLSLWGIGPKRGMFMQVVASGVFSASAFFKEAERSKPEPSPTDPKTRSEAAAYRCSNHPCTGGDIPFDSLRSIGM